jgi:hypothetical protein
MVHAIPFEFPSKKKMCSNCQPKRGFLSIYFESNPYDPSLKGVIMLESHAFFSKKKGITFYDMVFEVLYKHDVNSKAKDWLKTRN